MAEPRSSAGLNRSQLINTTAVRHKERCDSGGEKRRTQESGSSLQIPRRPQSSAGPGPSGSSLCWRHNGPLDVYCYSDEQIICAACASAKHIGHSFGCVAEERRRKEVELRNLRTKSTKILQKKEKQLKELGGKLQQIEEEAKNTRDDCECVLVTVIETIQRNFTALRQLIEGQEEDMKAQVHRAMKTLQEETDHMRETSAELDLLAETESNVHFLQKWASMRSLHHRDLLHPAPAPSVDLLLPFELTKGAVEQLAEQLQEFCDKRFALILKTEADIGELQESGGETENSSEDEDNEEDEEGEEDKEEEEDKVEEDNIVVICGTSTSHFNGLTVLNYTVTEQTVEPQTREEFLQYACVLSLDPYTAHEDLVIDKGDKRVRLSPQESKIPAVQCQERFAHRRQVLCREGLQGERCYYEVEVKGSKAEIALAYRAMDRKSRMSPSAFGANAQSWSLDRSIHYSVSHMGDSVRLTTPPVHQRIGVYLKFKEGSLSFYEVSERMKFLYKVEAEFKEPLYPGFWLGEKCCIRICDL